MVSLDQLAALDLLLWLTGSQRAARLEQTNQSTIVRRSQAVEECFGVSIRRDPDGWGLSGDTRLLQMERQLHQRARLLGHRPLRLHAPFWTLRERLRRLPRGWCANPATASTVCENPLDLLRTRVLDAALLTPTQMPANLEDLTVIDLYRSRIELTLFASDDEADPQRLRRQVQQRGELVLRLPSFLPASCLRRCREWFAELLPTPPAPCPPDRRAGEGSAELSVAFLTPEMQRVQGLPFRIDASVAAQPYVERLVLLRELEDQQPMQTLVQHLGGLFALQPQESGASSLSRV